jgi:hypothetical protein
MFERPTVRKKKLAGKNGIPAEKKGLSASTHESPRGGSRPAAARAHLRAAFAQLRRPRARIGAARARIRAEGAVHRRRRPHPRPATDDLGADREIAMPVHEQIGSAKRNRGPHGKRVVPRLCAAGAIARSRARSLTTASSASAPSSARAPAKLPGCRRGRAVEAPAAIKPDDLGARVVRSSCRPVRGSPR